MKISNAEADFMLARLSLTAELRDTLEAISRDSSVLLCDDDADSLRDLCGERLQTHGFGDDHQPNREGVELEKLITKLFVG